MRPEAEVSPTAHQLEQAHHRAPRRSASSVSRLHLVPQPQQMPLRRHATPVMVQPTNAMDGVTLPPPHSDCNTVG
jgi:hypothetical protein